jgi:hypothetical protein
MPYTPFHQSSSQTQVLDQILQRARNSGATGVAVIDLDGCLFDTRPRQTQIYRELAGQEDWDDLAQIQPDHFKDWSIPNTLSNIGLSPERVNEIKGAVNAYWFKTFFTSTYVLYDHAMPGGPALVRALKAEGTYIVYLTGRDETMRAGTEASLVRFGFPLGDRATLIVKPDFETDDTLFKAEALKTIAGFGEPIIFLDNEPSNVNRFKDDHPEALVVFVETDHSPKPIDPYASLPRIKGFLR